jgi:hypothetical protein
MQASRDGSSAPGPLSRTMLAAPQRGSGLAIRGDARRRSRHSARDIARMVILGLP